MTRQPITVTQTTLNIITLFIYLQTIQYAQNGFWTDHWTYTMDLIDSFLSIFPDKKASMLWESQVPFFMSPAIIRPRSERYELVDNPGNPGTSTIRVYRAVSAWSDSDFPIERQNALSAIYQSPEYVADGIGAGGVWQKHKRGSVFTVSIIAKLSMLGLLKFSTLDPLGMGVEMEGGKPGWNDAMNGLPGILGSSMPETYEALRIIRFVKKAVKQYELPISFPIEFAQFLSSLKQTLEVFAISSKDEAACFAFWDSSNNARELYRLLVVAYFDGSLQEFSASYLVDVLGAVELKLEDGIRKALALHDGLSPTYFYYECTEFLILPSDPTLVPQTTRVAALQFRMHQLPIFLEGPSRHFKIIDNVEEKRQVYLKSKNSELYDKELSMFTISGSLASMGQEVGRMMAFSPGWLENQSVWLHMSYKFYLELLRGDLYDEFYSEIKTGLVCFMDTEKYGRSPLEAASFIVSSAFPDQKVRFSFLFLNKASQYSTIFFLKR